MTEEKMKEILAAQKEFFLTGKTFLTDFRKTNLKKLYIAVKNNENEIESALAADLGKSRGESFMCEIGLVLSEIKYMIKHIGRLSAEKRVRTPVSQFASRSFMKPSPRGNTLIMSPWNYPFLLTFSPLADAIAAGNTAILKPSAYSANVCKITEKIVKQCFDENYVAVVNGGRSENASLLSLKFDFVFFTGSQSVGKEVLRRTAENLTPAVLELGGKSPCIVEKTAKLSLAAKRIVFGKFINCGQTCVAPDYVLCEKCVKEELIFELKKEITARFGNLPTQHSDYGKIINEKHFDRIAALIDKEKTVIGGETDRKNLKIAPTVMDNVEFSDAVMGEEIFGPILPIITYDDFSQVMGMIEKNKNPLALYIFSQDKAKIGEIISRVSFGGGCVNDTVIHLATSRMPFGGVGESGMGRYHGKFGFEAFSHLKSVVDKKTWIDLPMRYSPNSGFYNKLLHIFLR